MIDSTTNKLMQGSTNTNQRRQLRTQLYKETKCLTNCRN